MLIPRAKSLQTHIYKETVTAQTDQKWHRIKTSNKSDSEKATVFSLCWKKWNENAAFSAKNEIC